ncbi:MAG: hypothetical protein JWP31_596 [Aeromicrobium sp.]|nr:hypothetical protein [Aeromicrobium sp.]
MRVDPSAVTGDDLTVRFDDSGVPVDVVAILDLDGVTAYDALLAAVHARPDRVAVIGVATTPLPREAEAVLSALTVTLVGRHHAVLPQLAAMTVAVDDPVRVAAEMVTHAAAAPRAAFAASGLLAIDASVTDGLVIESFAYSVLLGGPEFAAWRAGRPVAGVPSVPEPVRLQREGDVLRIVLDHPERRNAFGRRLRAALIEALRLVELDPTIREVTLTGRGPTFCSGGDLDEFGQATDLAAAHAVRLDQSAGLAVHRVADRVTAVLHGSCIGAGIEVPAFASTVLARPGTTFRLPELAMGLVPGAGGTASIPRRIGRWRTAYMVLSGASIELDDALDWGLVDGRA